MKRLGLTIARIHETIYLPPTFDPDPITSVSDKEFQEFSIEGFSSFCRKFLKGLHFDFKIPNCTEELKGRLVQGPNGPSILSAHQDARAILDNDEIADAISDFLDITNGNWIAQVIHTNGSSLDSNVKFKTGRISLISEGGGKTRTIAIGDY